MGKEKRESGERKGRGWVEMGGRGFYIYILPQIKILLEFVFNEVQSLTL